MIITEEWLRQRTIPDKKKRFNVISAIWLGLNFKISGVEVSIKNSEQIPRNQTVIYAMNHISRYDNFPFQRALIKLDAKYSIAWVKAKYYKNNLMAAFINYCQNIPICSKEYISRNTETDDIDAVFKSGMSEITRLSLDALFNRNLSIIIFPEGTRSKSLCQGKTGLAQLAHLSEKKVIPVGVNYTDKLYKDAPWAQTGLIEYRIGVPLVFPKLNFSSLFSSESKKYSEEFEKTTKKIMSRINELVDDEYK